MVYFTSLTRSSKSFKVINSYAFHIWAIKLLIIRLSQSKHAWAIQWHFLVTVKRNCFHIIFPGICAFPQPANKHKDERSVFRSAVGNKNDLKRPSSSRSLLVHSKSQRSGECSERNWFPTPNWSLIYYTGNFFSGQTRIGVNASSGHMITVLDWHLRSQHLLLSIDTRGLGTSVYLLRSHHCSLLSDSNS